jgi:hypothetical protein
MFRSRTVLVHPALLLLLMAVTFTASANEEGGLRLGLEFGNPNAVLIIRPVPFDFKIGYNFTEAGNLFLSADYRVVSKYQIVNVLHFFLGVGVYVQLHFVPTVVDLGARIPFGLQVFLIDNVLEIFLELAPTVGFLPTIIAFPEWQGYVGFTILIPKR